MTACRDGETATAWRYNLKSGLMQRLTFRVGRCLLADIFRDARHLLTVQPL